MHIKNHLTCRKSPKIMTHRIPSVRKNNSSKRKNTCSTNKRAFKEDNSPTVEISKLYRFFHRYYHFLVRPFLINYFLDIAVPYHPNRINCSHFIYVYDNACKILIYLKIHALLNHRFCKKISQSNLSKSRGHEGVT